MGSYPRIGAQGSLLTGNRPSIPVVYGSRQIRHAVIWTGWVWEETAEGPFIHEVTYNDPEKGKDTTPLTIAEYKTQIFEPMSYDGNSVYVAVMEWGGSRSALMAKARDGLDDFVNRRGRFRGGPRYYNPRDYEIYPRPAR